MLRYRSVLAVLALCGVLSACQQVAKQEDLLAAAGFQLIPANTPQRQASLRSLPPHRFIHQVRNGQLVFIYADPTICNCLYVGNQAAYETYQQAVFAKKQADEAQMNAQINEMNEDSWRAWGVR